MNIKDAGLIFDEFVERSERMKEQCWSMVLLAPQIIPEDELVELRRKADIVATNFDSVAGAFYQFGKMSPQSKFYSPNGKHNKN